MCWWIIALMECQISNNNPYNIYYKFTGHVVPEVLVRRLRNACARASSHVRIGQCGRLYRDSSKVCANA